jgi:SagB-type dehydrogenase family enzyme
MLDAADTRSLALLYHLNSEPWLNPDASQVYGLENHFKTTPGTAKSIALPAAEETGALLQLIRRRSSCRDYAARPLSLDHLATLLAGAYGLTRLTQVPGGFEFRARSVPSAGARYPLELYVLLRNVETLADGLYHYGVLEHALEPLETGTELVSLAELMLAAPLLEHANVVVFMAAVFDRTLHKYGGRGYRYILLEAGHTAQNLCLLATERGLASLCVGGFSDSATNRFLRLEPGIEAVIYCVGVGHPA